MGKSKDLATGASYVDTSGDTMTGNLGIGAAPTRALHVEHATDATMIVNAAAGNQATYLLGEGGASKFNMSHKASDDTFQIYNYYNSGISLKIDSSGNVTKPNNPWFSAHGASSGWVSFPNAGSDNILNVFNGGTVYQNTGGGFNTSTSSYTAPVSGRYCFLYNTYTKGGASTSAGQYLYPRLYVNNSPTQPRENIKHYNGENYDEGREMTIMFNLAANDVVKCGCWSSHTTNQYYGGSFHWQGFLIG